VRSLTVTPLKNGYGLGLLACFIAVAIWGAQLPIAKDAFYAVDPFTSTAIRYAVAVFFLSPVLVSLEGWQALRFGDRAKPAWLLGVVGMSASPMLVFLGISMCRAEHAVVIVALQPTIAAMLQWVVYSKRPASFTLGCIALALIGVVLVVTKGNLHMTQSPREFLGIFFVLMGAACWVLYTMNTHKLAGWSTWRTTVLTMIPGMLANFLVVAVLVGSGVLTLPTPDKLWLVRWQLSYLCFAGVLFSMLAWNFGNQRIGPLNATLFINFMPVMTFAFRAFQGTQFAAVELVGAGLVVAALVANNLYLRSEFLAAQRLAKAA
jgi:drug/metabolite transporter (DMT)-like permease